MENKCESLSLYIINELTEQGKEQFERHLKTCAQCQSELDSLQETWQALSYDFDEVDVPESLKSDVMDFIFEENRADHAQEEVKKHRLIDRVKFILTKQFTPLSACITAILTISLIGLFWNHLQLKNEIAMLKNDVVEPVQIVTTFSLRGENLATNAIGTAYLLKEGDNTSLIVELNNMPSTKEDEVYQVWLLKNGNRQNAGTLKPDQNGNGLITYRLPKDISFDDIGITLEPNPYNTQPQGEKVMGTF